MSPSGARYFDFGRLRADFERLAFSLPSTTTADSTPSTLRMPASRLVFGASNGSLSTTTSFFSFARSDSAETSAARFTFLGTVYE